ncbi:MAG: hypothetical protein QOE93_558, partial [Actinomycetota bacterium]|nr:hypothetical protein [Actinomycetota bacterium]
MEEAGGRLPPRPTLTPYLRHRLVALAGLAVVAAPAFLIGGMHWENDVDRSDALTRFRAAGVD